MHSTCRSIVQRNTLSHQLWCLQLSQRLLMESTGEIWTTLHHQGHLTLVSSGDAHLPAWW